MLLFINIILRKIVEKTNCTVISRIKNNILTNMKMKRLKLKIFVV